jgi:hypothetical protein
VVIGKEAAGVNSALALPLAWDPWAVTSSWVWPAAAAVAVRPALWGVALRQALRLAAPGWWRRWPPVPRPDPGYVRFRLQTAFGDPATNPTPADVVAYLEWCRRFPA